MVEQHQFCTFLLGVMYFGVPAQEVQEVMNFQETTPVPLAPSVVHGLLNLRGQIVTTINLRRRLGLPEAPADVVSSHLVVRTGDGVISFLVDEIGEVLDVPQDRFEPPPETMEAAAKDLIRGVFKLEGRLLLVLNVEKAATVTAVRTLSREV